MKSLILPLVLALVPSSAFSAEEDLQKTTIVVKVGNVPDAEGKVCVSLHHGRLNRPGSNDKNTQTQCLPSVPEGVTVTFKDIAAGKYAISAFHDRNGDEKLNHRLTGPRREALTYLGNENATVWDAKFKELEKKYTGGENVVDLSLRLRTAADRKAKAEAAKAAATPTPASTPESK